MIGRTFSHYRIQAPLGEGNMGVVYRARDLHLERDVALKVIRADAVTDEVARKRFRREALALSRIHNPHVATVFDFGSEGGLDFLVMELVEGTSLDHLETPRPESDVIALGIQIAEALEAAHERGVIHRDLKPANMMQTARGLVKVLDFGLARLRQRPQGLDLSKSLTETHVAVGTLRYMAPEQLLARKVDARADLYALGVVLYELAIGRSPYRETAPTALVYEIVNQPVPPPRTIRPEMSERLERILLRCLAKDPESRYLSAGELILDLRGETRAPATPARSARARRSPPLVPLAMLGVALALVIAIGTRFTELRDRVFGGRSLRALAVLPLEDLSRDPDREYFADGMTDELITNLAKIAALRVISRVSVMRYKGSTRPLPEIAKKLGVDGVVLGTIHTVGDRVRIRIQLVRAANEKSLWAESYERPLSDALALEAEVARTIAEEIRVHLSAKERARLEPTRSVDPAATDAYLRGRFHAARFTRDDVLAAIARFNHAIELDPRYAPAYAALASTYCMGSASVFEPADAMPKAKAASLKAIAVDPGLAEAHACLGYVTAFFDWQWEEAEREFRRAISLAPGDATSHLWYGYFLIYLKRFDQARTEMRRGWEIDPLSPLAAMMQMWPLFLGRDYDGAVALGRRLLSSDSTLGNTYLVLGQAYTMKGEYDSARAVIRQGLGRAVTDNGGSMAWLGYGYAREGRRDSAMVMLERLRAPFPSGTTDPYSMAVLFAGLLDRDHAFQQLDRCLAARTENAAYAAVDPAMDPIRADPRFAEIVRRVGLSPERLR